MSWVKVDDQMPRHPKLLGLGRDRLMCQGVWLDGMCYASAYLTDGFVPAAALERGCDRYAERLVKAGLWDKVEGGYRVHDYHDYQPTREQVTEARKRNAERQSRHRNGVSNGVTNEAVTTPRPVPVPSSPVPEYVQTYIDPVSFYAEKVGRRPGAKERAWIEDLQARFSTTEVVRGMQAVDKGSDYLKRLDAFMEGRAA
jgi:hypothetical protein